MSAHSRPKSFRRRNTIPGQFAWRLIEMLESPAYRALTLSAHRILARVEIALVKPPPLEGREKSVFSHPSRDRFSGMHCGLLLLLHGPAVRGVLDACEATTVWLICFS